jgi:hypothetical protein
MRENIRKKGGARRMGHLASGHHLWPPHEEERKKKKKRFLFY